MTHATPHMYDDLPHPELDAQFYERVPLKRLIAWVFDLCIVVILSLIVVLASLGILALLAVPVGFLVNLAYRILTLRNSSATLGMRLVGIEIRNREGNRLNTSESVWHSVIFVVSFMTILGIAANAISMLVSGRGQGLHDLILGTTAINRPADL